MDLQTIGTAYTTLQFITEAFNLALATKIDEKTRLKIYEAMQRTTSLQNNLFQAQQQLLLLQQENHELKKQIETSQNWASRAAQYKLVKTIGSAMVYEFQGEPHHYACPTCFEINRISILQDSGDKYSSAWPCKTCDQSYKVSQAEPIRFP
jgi:DNA repair exonuclease SbcCD ATPase subunit